MGSPLLLLRPPIGGRAALAWTLRRGAASWPRGGGGEGGSWWANPPLALPPALSQLSQDLLLGKRAALSRAITLCESTNRAQYAQGTQLLQHLLEVAREREGVKAFRVGVTGPPGAGKSSLIEKLGGIITGGGARLAVLAVDPSSQLSGGSILGDKTRMPLLAQDARAYVRPTSTRGTLGGIARNTADAALLCEAAGHEWVLVETVGVGQSETAVMDVVDCMLLVLPPAGGDGLQGVKRGIVEFADLIVVNKADGELKGAAGRAAAEYSSASRLMRARLQCWVPQVLECSAHTSSGLPELWQAIQDLKVAMEGGGELASQRAAQRRRRLWGAVQEGLLQDLAAKTSSGGLEEAVEQGVLLPRHAAELLLRTLGNRMRSP